MKVLGMAVAAFLVIIGSSGLASAGSFVIPLNPERDPKGAAVHMSYEHATFTPGKPDIHLPGAELAAPGDMYRVTIFRDSKYANDPSYEIVQAVAGVHIDDYDWNKASGDGKQEWGRIQINGKPMRYTVPGGKFPDGSSQFMEFLSDREISPEGGPILPPYVFTVTEELKKGNSITVEVTNLTKDGKTEGTEFGNFVVNRIGLHVWYKKK